MTTLDPEIQKRIDAWLSGPYDADTKAEIRALAKRDPAALADSFSSGISFGTGGMRALMGVGTSRMNIYTVRIATQGLANYLLKEVSSPSVLIGYDSRHNSHLFAEQAAQVLAGNGIRVFFLKELRPTPFISFSCRFKKCSAAIMITASHNPKEYNGYKVYWSDGAQVVPPHDTGIMQEVSKIKETSQVRMIPSFHHALIEEINQPPNPKLDRAYLDAIAPLQHFPEDNKRFGSALKIAYTSLHGTGITIIPTALREWGFSSLTMVEKQITLDGDFPTVKFPNPEYKETLQLGIDTLIKAQADILLASDPDADRLGVVVLHKGKPVILNGNEVASICVQYLCEVLTHQNKMPQKAAIVTTIVSSDLLKAITTAYGKTCFEVLTGFKYIGEKIHLWETSKDSYVFLFGAEESYGYLIGTHARDKDAIVSSCLISEIALHAKRKGQTLVDMLNAIYQKYGIFREGQLSLNFPPDHTGMDQMHALMEKLRKQPPKSFCDKPVISMEDYKTGISYDFTSKTQEPLTLPQSDVLLIRLSDGSKLVIRPSGTEPKVKIYAGVHMNLFNDIESGIQECDERVTALLASAKQDLHV